MNSPQISVVMSVYNGEKYLKEAVDSILNQTFRDFEFIVINDGSADGSLEILKEYERKDIRVRIISRENKGLVNSLNEGVSISKGEYIARMDTDDVSTTERLEKQIRFMKENNLVLCGSWATGINEKGETVSRLDYTPGPKGIRFYSLIHNPFIHPSVMFRKEIFEKVGGYKENFKYIEDYELWTRIVFKYKTSNIKESLIKYRIHSEQITKKNNLVMRLRGLKVRLFAICRFLFRS